MAAVLAPVTPLLGRPQDPDPQPGRRMSIRPQPTRAPRDEAIALGPHQRSVPAQEVAKGPTLKWGSGGMVGGTAAAALRLPLTPGVTGTATSHPPPPPPPKGCRGAPSPAEMRGHLSQSWPPSGDNLREC